MTSAHNPGLKRLLKFWILVGSLGALCSCAGGKLPQPFHSSDDAGESLIRSLPTEMREKFEVLDAPPTPVASVEPESSKKSKLARVKKQPKKVKKTAKKIFTYPNRRPTKDPIWVGEKMVLEITYIGLAAGDVTIEALPYKTINDRKVYHIRGNAQSSKLFGLIYRLDDTIQSFIDFEGFFSHRFHLLLNESKQQRDSLELYDSEKGETFYWNRWKHVEKDFVETKQTFPIPPFPQDSVSALFYLRALPLKVGDQYKFPLISEGKVLDTEVDVVRKEIMQTPLGRISTIVVKPETKFQGVAQKQGDSFIWYSDDDRRILLRVEAKVKIGTVVARLKEYEPGTPPQ